MNALAHGSEDILQQFIDLLEKIKADYCVLGGLAVNVYSEPVVSLDLDIVVATNSMDAVLKKAQTFGFSAERFPHSINLNHPKSDLRIQLQSDLRYQDFISRASEKTVIGYKMKVASLDDVFQGKIWAYSDEQRRKSKRQKDLADIFRLVESHPHLQARLPKSIGKSGL